MKLASQSQLSSWLPSIHPQVWIFAIGRFFSEVGTGFTLFYAPIFFVNQLGLSATSVGVALGSASISGIVGRIGGGSFADSGQWPPHFVASHGDFSNWFSSFSCNQ